LATLFEAADKFSSLMDTVSPLARLHELDNIAAVFYGAGDFAHSAVEVETFLEPVHDDIVA